MRRKGISPLIAAVLLIAFTMAVASIFAQWAPSVIQSAQSGVDDRQAQVIDSANSRMKIQKASFNSSSGNYTITVQNTGSANITNYTFTVLGNPPTQKRVTGTLEPKGIKTVEVSTSDTGKSDIEVDAENVPSSTKISSDQIEDDSSNTGGGGGGSNSAPTASFTDNVSNPNTGDVIEFDGTGSSDSDGSIDTYEWDWTNDGTYEGSGSTATHSYSSSGDKTVKLRVTDDSGATDTTTNTVSVQSGTTKIYWNTSTDWDNAVSETGVVHEAASNSDLSDASVLKKGYSVNSPVESSNLHGYWPLQEDSGSTANDFSGNSNDGAIQDATLGSDNLLGVSSYNFDESNDWIDVGTQPLSDSSDFTIYAWQKYKNADTSGFDTIISQRNSYSTADVGLYIDEGDSNNPYAIGVGDSWGAFYYNTNAKANENGDDVDVWRQIAVVKNGNDYIFYRNGTITKETYTDSSSWTTDDTLQIGSDDDGAHLFSGNLANVRVYNTALSDSQMDALYDTAAGNSTLETATKSFSSSTKPDLQNLDYNLNSQNITLTIIGSPGTASEEKVTQGLDGSSSYTLSWSNSHTDFRTKINMSTDDLSKTPTVNKIELK